MARIELRGEQPADRRANLREIASRSKCGEGSAVVRASRARETTGAAHDCTLSRKRRFFVW